jgi:hypothetical protein
LLMQGLDDCTPDRDCCSLIHHAASGRLNHADTNGVRAKKERERQPSLAITRGESRPDCFVHLVNTVSLQHHSVHVTDQRRSVSSTWALPPVLFTPA